MYCVSCDHCWIRSCLNNIFGPHHSIPPISCMTSDWASLDPLPVELRLEVLRHVQFSARATCRDFRAHQEATCKALRLHCSQEAATPLMEAVELQLLLARLPQLRDITAHQWPFNNLQVITTPFLTSINLGDSPLLQDLSPLSACTALTFLSLQNCSSLVDLGPLLACTALTSLDLNCADPHKFHCLSDVMRGITCLPALPSLTHLAVCNNSIIDFTPLSTCTRLQFLDLSMSSRWTTSTQYLSIPSHLPFLHLTHLDLSSSCIRHLNPLAGSTCLKFLNIYDTYTSSLLPLNTCTNLTSLYAGNCGPLAGLSTPLSGFTKLRHLSLRRIAELPGIAALASCIHLEALEIADNGWLADIGVLTVFTCLTSLHLRGCYGIRDYSPVSLCTSLTALDFWCVESNVKLLANLRGMKILCLRGSTLLHNINSLIGMCHLEELDVLGCRSLSITAICNVLDAFPSLTYFRCPHRDLRKEDEDLLYSTVYASRRRSMGDMGPVFWMR